MTDPSHQIDQDVHRELRSHATALRGLASDLLRDPHAADDVAQQTLTKAWTSRDRIEPGPMRGWLQRTLTNFTRQWRRGEVRRKAHEAEAELQAGQRREPSPAEILMRREALQSVTNAVLQLDEPYQTTVFLRYFEDLPPRTIARRTQTNIATVKSRLARGLVMLRQKLERAKQGGDWRTALATAFGIPIGISVVPVAAGVLLMNTTMKVTLAAAALCIGGLMLYDTDTPAPANAASASDRNGESATALEASANTQPMPTERTAAAPSKPQDASLSHPYSISLEVFVVDELGIPVAGFVPELAPPGGVLRKASEGTNEHGKVVVQWAARAPTAEIEILDPRRHRRKVTVRHGTPTRIAMLGSNSRSRYSWSTSGGLVALTVDVPRISGLPVLPGQSTSHQLIKQLHPHAVFSEPGLVTLEPADEPEYEQTLSDLRSLVTNVTYQLDTTAAGIRISPGSKFVVQTREDGDSTAGYASLKGFVFGEDGKPAEGIPVALLGSGPQPLHRTKTKKDGSYSFDKLVRNNVTVRAGGLAAGLGSASLLVEQGIYTQDVHLKTEACIRGTLADEQGKAIKKAKIEWFSDDGLWADRAETNDDGSFLLANLPHASGTLYAWDKDTGRRFPIAHRTSVAPDGVAIALKGQASEGSKLTMQPTARVDSPLEKLRLRVRQVSTNFSRGIPLPRVTQTVTGADGTERKSSIEMPTAPWHMAKLPEGFYEVEMWLPGCGSKSLGRHWVDGKIDCDLGPAPLPAPGQLHFALPEGSSQPEGLRSEIVSLRPPFDVRIETLKSLHNDVQLAEGDYVLATKHGDSPPQFQRFQVAGGKTTILQVSW